MDGGHEYTFDVRMFAAVRIKAASISEARATVHDNLGCVSCNAGAWPNGDPILFEASIDDDELPCTEIDGEPTGD